MLLFRILLFLLVFISFLTLSLINFKISLFTFYFPIFNYDIFNKTVFAFCFISKKNSYFLEKQNMFSVLFSQDNQKFKEKSVNLFIKNFIFLNIHVNHILQLIFNFMYFFRQV